MNVKMLMIIIIIIIGIIVVGNVNAIIFVISEKDKNMRLLDSTKNTVTNHLYYLFVQYYLWQYLCLLSHLQLLEPGELKSHFLDENNTDCIIKHVHSTAILCTVCTHTCCMHSTVHIVLSPDTIQNTIQNIHMIVRT